MFSLTLPTAALIQTLDADHPDLVGSRRPRGARNCGKICPLTMMTSRNRVQFRIISIGCHAGMGTSQRSCRRPHPRCLPFPFSHRRSDDGLLPGRKCVSGRRYSVMACPSHRDETPSHRQNLCKKLFFSSSSLIGVLDGEACTPTRTPTRAFDRVAAALRRPHQHVEANVIPESSAMLVSFYKASSSAMLVSFQGSDTISKLAIF